MKVNYIHEKLVENAIEGETILDISLKNEIPHINACGGKAKCSTCRVIILENIQNISKINEKEAALKEIKGFEENIRLACQTKVLGDISLRRLVIDSEDLEGAVEENAETTGREEKLAILFSDIRGYTSFSEKALPYDTIHILNRYFKIMGEKILQFNGYIDKYIGDGLMAIFGLDKTNCKNPAVEAVLCGLEMLKAMEDINSYLQKNFEVSFDIGIGIHYGSAIVGKIGHPGKMQFTAIGDTVNTASRIESANKLAGTRLLISEELKNSISENLVIGKTLFTNLKGKKGNFLLHEVKGLTLAQNNETMLKNFLLSNFNIADVPKLLRLGFHDACTYNPEIKTGGFQSISLSEENLDLPINKDLVPTIKKLRLSYSEFLETNKIQISLSDYFAHAIAISIERVGGPRIKPGFGRIDSNGKITTGLFPDEKDSIQKLIETFFKMGFTKKELVALSGAHTLGKANGKPFTEDYTLFSNSYFKTLLSMEFQPDETSGILESDKALLKDDECRKLVVKYSREQHIFFKDFVFAMEKLLSLGQKDLVDEF
ncbi:MAG: 2Fe-2S iron-sulfur cluster binding domain-containing protein [Leptospiraceae bacterium]|nr:2Fe-2S iron-sulfur cluster binding domain-containing protein [Leptospiraceae bacterium]